MCHIVWPLRPPYFIVFFLCDPIWGTLASGWIGEPPCSRIGSGAGEGIQGALRLIEGLSASATPTRALRDLQGHLQLVLHLLQGQGQHLGDRFDPEEVSEHLLLLDGLSGNAPGLGLLQEI